MRQMIEEIVRAAVERAARDMGWPPDALAALDPAVERPREKGHGDWASTVALKLAKPLKLPPRQIAEAIAAAIQGDARIQSVEVAGPGFINLWMTAEALQEVIRQASSEGPAFARLAPASPPQRVNLEFISANPTGPMHVGHGRWAALGSALANLLEHAGWQVTREFYINDAGRQMDIFGESVVVRYLQLLGDPVEMPEESYGGAYVREIAQSLLDTQGPAWRTADPAERLVHFREYAYQQMLAQMQGLCERIGVHFDVWYSERSLYLPEAAAADTGASANGEKTALPAAPPAAPVPPATPSAAASALLPRQDAPAGGAIPASAAAPAGGAALLPTQPGQSPIQRCLSELAAGGYLYQKEGATWFRSTDFGDDKDRVLVKADGSYTYFCPDIAYHATKFARGSDYLINIWGADHHGYVVRMQAAMAALGHAGRLSILLGQLVNLFRGGEAVRMSKRTGEMVSFAELVDEVGADATKYLMLTRSTEQPIDFDIEAAKLADNSNPVYYVQYAHARICSLLAKAKAAGVAPSDAHLGLLTDPAELDLARNFARLPDLIESAARDLAPYRLTYYAQELASDFHSFYTRCQIIVPDRPLAEARLYLAAATKSVLALVLGLCGVSAPERM